MCGVAIAALVVALIVMVGFAPVRSRIHRVQHLEITHQPGHGTMTPLFENLNAVGASVRRVALVESDGVRTVRIEVAGLGGNSSDAVVSALRARDEVLNVSTVVGHESV